MSNLDQMKERYAELVKQRDENKELLISEQSRLKMYQEEYSKALQELKDEFGVESYEEAEAMFTAKSHELEQFLNKCELELSEVQ